MPHYQWKRRWEIVSGGDAGADPALARGNTFPLDGLADKACLVLLGEPGMGKSTAIEDEVARLPSEGRTVAGLNLKTITSDTALREELDFALADLGAAGDLFIDSLDEAMLRIEPIFDAIARWLRRGDAAARLADGRLKVRIACRSQQWQTRFTDELTRLIKEPARLAVLRLAPLTEADMAETVERDDRAAFLKAISDRGIVALAERPVTLLMLADIWREQRALPERRAEIYGQGCLRLAREIDWDSGARQRAAYLDAGQRLCLAARIACVSMLSQRPIIRDGGMGAADSATLDLSDLAGQEPADSGPVAATERHLREVLHTALFRPLGEGRFVFAHQTYAEYLAARHLLDRKVPMSAILAALRAPGEDRPVVTPQLLELSAWLGSLDRALFQQLVRDNPAAMLRSDVATADPADREALVEALLEAASDLRETDMSFDRALYGRLAHPGLADQLRPRIRDRTLHWLPRRMAIDIGEACCAQALEADYLSVVLDVSDAVTMRSQALHALQDVAGDDTRRALVPVALGQLGNDPDDDLRGWALPLVWPGFVSTQEVIRSLTEPRRDNYIGRYGMFLHSDFVARLPDQDVVEACRTFAEVLPQRRSGSRLKGLIEALTVRVLKHLTDDLIGPVAGFIAALKVHHGWHVWTAEARQAITAWPDTVRRRFASAVADHLPDDEPVILVFDPPLLTADDLDWSLEKCVGACSPERARFWADVAKFLWDGQLETYEAIYRHRGVEAIRERFAGYLEGVDLDSDVAADARRRYRIDREMIDEEPGISFKKSVADHIAAIEAGNLDAFWSLFHLDDRVGGDGEFDDPVEALKFYALLSEAERSSFTAVCERFLLTDNPRTDDRWWSKPNWICWPAVAGAYALWHLAHKRLEVVDSLSPDIWARWVPAIVTFFDPRSDRLGPLILSQAYAKAPEALLGAIRHRVELHLSADQLPELERMLHGWWTPELNDIAEEIIHRPSCSWIAIRRTVNLLAEHAPERARAFFQAAIQDSAAPHRSERLALGLRLMADRLGDAILAAMRADAQLSSGVLNALQFDGSGWISAEFLPSLSERGWADLYCFAMQQPPEEPEDEASDDSAVGRASPGQFYGDIPRILADIGTSRAADLLEALAEEFPKQADILRWHALAARRKHQLTTWVPFSPSAVLAMLDHPGARPVRNEDELQQVILLALDRIQERLQGVTPEARLLWNTVDPWRPKEEADLSDYLVNRLRDLLSATGIIANREVQIGVERVKGADQRTDIQVEATIPDGPGRTTTVTVLIEVKGCWNRELHTAMETQLRDRYLGERGLTHSIYLVGWYVCPRWADATIAGRRPTTADTLGALRERMEAEGRRLSTNGIRITARFLDLTL